jgi:hypothetical protein
MTHQGQIETPKISRVTLKEEAGGYAKARYNSLHWRLLTSLGWTTAVVSDDGVAFMRAPEQ